MFFNLSKFWAQSNNVSMAFYFIFINLYEKPTSDGSTTLHRTVICHFTLKWIKNGVFNIFVSNYLDLGSVAFVEAPRNCKHLISNWHEKLLRAQVFMCYIAPYILMTMLIIKSSINFKQIFFVISFILFF